MNDDLSFVVRRLGPRHVPENVEHLPGQGNPGTVLAADRSQTR